MVKIFFILNIKLGITPTNIQLINKFTNFSAISCEFSISTFYYDNKIQSLSSNPRYLALLSIR